MKFCHGQEVHEGAQEEKKKKKKKMTYFSEVPDYPSNFRYPKPTHGFLIHWCVKLFGDFSRKPVKKENGVKQSSLLTLPSFGCQRKRFKKRLHMRVCIVTECTLTNWATKPLRLRLIEIISKSLYIFDK